MNNLQNTHCTKRFSVKYVHVHIYTENIMDIIKKDFRVTDSQFCCDYNILLIRIRTAYWSRIIALS